MTVYIHVPNKKRTNTKPSGKKGTFAKYKISHMEIDCREPEEPTQNRCCNQEETNMVL
jgi:hypothetical protein